MGARSPPRESCRREVVPPMCTGEFALQRFSESGRDEPRRVGGSTVLKRRLTDLVPVPEYQARFHWLMWDMLMWDNRSTMHRRDPFDAGARRVMHRTQLKGDRSVEAVA